jgi:tetratricopeptide (TPR) repeat protein
VTGDVQAGLRELRAALQSSPRRSDILASAARLELELRRTNAAIDDLRRAVRLDPRSPDVLTLLAISYLDLQRLPDAHAAITRARALRPTSLRLAYTQARIAAAQGDLDGVRRVFREVEQTLGLRPIVAYTALREDLIFALDSAQLRLMLALTPADLDGARGDWALALAEGHTLLGHPAAARAYGDTAAVAYAELQRSVGAHGQPSDASQLVALRGLALAYAGQAAPAVAEAERAVAMTPDFDYALYLAARVHLMTGNWEQALARLERIVRLRFGWYTGAWLRIDGRLSPLRGEPAFQDLVRTTG